VSKRDLICVKRDLIGVKQDLIGVKRDLISVKRDLLSVKRDLLSVKRISVKRDLICVQKKKRRAVPKKNEKKRTSRPWTRAPHSQPGTQSRAVPKKKVSEKGKHLVREHILREPV